MDTEIGTGKQDMTAFIPGLGMMGYGQHHNIVKEIATPLRVRALLMKEGEKVFFLVHLEQAFVTLAIKEEVIVKINELHPGWKINDANLAITAQHTHSAPGGYSHYPLYNFTIPGFQTRVFDKVVSAILDAMEESWRNKKPCVAYWGRTYIDPSKEVAFNRSMTAHTLNPEAEYHREEEKHLAVDRQMEGLFFKDSHNNVVAFLNWFGVHCTSVSSYNQRIHHDNKGVAADLFEKSHAGTTAFFLQASAGDVSPNFIWDTKTRLMRGKYKDQYENAAYNGELQFREAEKISPDHQMKGPIEFHHVFLDMSLEVAPPAHGVGFFKGTLEGPGVSAFLGDILAKVSRYVRNKNLRENPELHKKFYEAHGNKDIVLDHRNGSFLGIPLKVWKKLPPVPEPSVEAFRKTARANALETLPWVPSILPFQVLRMGAVLFAFVPGEISVMAGRRLKQSLLSETSDLGIKEIFITSYANAYMGYIVTPEEYDQQCYEGGHTVYGRETLRGIIKGFSLLALKLRGEELSLKLPLSPFHFPPEELRRRSI